MHNTKLCHHQSQGAVAAIAALTLWSSGAKQSCPAYWPTRRYEPVPQPLDAPGELRLVGSRRDLALAGSLAGLAVLAWCLPERHWDRVCHRLALLQPWRIRGNRLASFGYAASSAPHWFGPAADACARAQLANVYRERLQLLACYRPGASRHGPASRGVSISRPRPAKARAPSFGPAPSCSVLCLP